jgi:paraquat-inducible protein A
VRQSLLLTGVETLWRNEMLPLSWLVFLCGALLPLGLLGVFAALYAPERFGCKPGGLVSLATVARELEHWAIPEVQVLAVLVALMKLGSLVQVQLGAGFWCYCGMALALLIAQHSFDRETYGGHAVPAASAPQNP